MKNWITGPEGTAASGHVKPPPFQVSESEIPEGPAGPITSAETDNAPNLQTDGGYSQPAFSQSGNEDLGYVDEDAGYGGSKPTKGPGDE